MEVSFLDGIGREIKVLDGEPAQIGLGITSPRFARGRNRQNIDFFTPEN